MTGGHRWDTTRRGKKDRNDPTVWDFQRSSSNPDVGFQEAVRQKQYHRDKQSHIQETEEERLNWNMTRECCLSD